MRIEIIKNEGEAKYVHGTLLDVGHTSHKYWGDPLNRNRFDGFVRYMEGREDADFGFILRKHFLIQFLDIFYNRTGYTDTDSWKTKDMYGDPLIGMTFGDTQYGIVFDENDISQMITYLREKYATFYTPERKGPCYIDYHSLAKQRQQRDGKKIWISSCPSFRNDEFNKMVEARRAAKKYSLKQFEKDLGIKHLDLPWELSRDESEKVMNYCMNDVICSEALMREKERLEEQEAIEGLRTLYYAVATRHERALRHLDECLNEDRDWPETSYMLEYIRKRVETADDNVECLCKENDTLRNQVENLKDLIDKIHEETDI